MSKDIELDHRDWTYINDLMIEEKQRLCMVPSPHKREAEARLAAIETKVRANLDAAWCKLGETPEVPIASPVQIDDKPDGGRAVTIISRSRAEPGER